MSSIKVEDYSSKSIVVYGETKIYKEINVMQSESQKI